jgi:hypothetical protein
MIYLNKLYRFGYIMVCIDCTDFLKDRNIRNNKCGRLDISISLQMEQAIYHKF